MRKCRIKQPTWSDGANTPVALTAAIPLLAQAQTNAPPAAPAAPHWDASISLGATVTSGNSDSTLFTLTGRAERLWDRHEIHLGTDLAYGKACLVYTSDAAD